MWRVALSSMGLIKPDFRCLNCSIFLVVDDDRLTHTRRFIQLLLLLLRTTPTPSPPPPAPPLQPPPPFLDLIILLRHNRQPYRCFSCSSECTNSGVRPAGSNCFVLPTPITHGWCSTAQSRKTTAERKLQAPAFPFPCILSSCGQDSFIRTFYPVAATMEIMKKWG
jgi:hypothetical protein